MPKPRKPPRRVRKKLSTELQRLTVPVRTAGSNRGDARDGDPPRSPPAAEAEQEDKIRRMIEAAYT